MDWKQVTVLTTTQGAELVGDILQALGASGTAIEDSALIEEQRRAPGEWDYIDEALYADAGEPVRVSAWYPADAQLQSVLAQLRERLSALPPAGLGALQVQLADVRDEDWANNWRQYYKPFTIGERLLVCPQWEQADAQGRTVVYMEPGMAFGTGTHETTAMCLTLIERYVRPGDLVLDIGCGTGILGIAAVRLGARGALAVDRDSVAVAATRNNSALNGVQPQVCVRQGDLFEGVGNTGELVVMNIIADVIIGAAADALTHTKPGGLLIASGIILARESDVLAALTAAGFVLQQTLRQGEWVALALRRP